MENLNTDEKVLVLAERIKKKISVWKVLQAICTLIKEGHFPLERRRN